MKVIAQQHPDCELQTANCELFSEEFMMKTCAIALICILSSFGLSAVAQNVPGPVAPASATSQTAAAVPPEYHLLPEDNINVLVRNEPDFSAEQVVDPMGNINMPQIGLIHVEGLTQRDLADMIRAKLTKWIIDPKIQITLSNLRKPKVYVLGQVLKPGMYEFKTGDRVMEAIALAGSHTETAALDQAKITHSSSSVPIPLNLKRVFHDADMTDNMLLQDGDTIYIPEDTISKYFVLGQVVHPSTYRLTDKVTVMEALTMAGGPTARASLKNTFIIRGDPKKPQRIRVDLDKLTKKADLTQNIVLQPGDVVWVDETSKPDWPKIAGILSTFVNSLYIIGL
jgi:polysaccharide export outer membrane protein